MFNDTPPEKPVIVVFTGNSNVGLAAIDRLLEYGDDIVIRAVVRKAKNADPKWESYGIETLVADVRRPAQLQKVFDKSNAVLWATPCTQDRAELTEKFLQGCIDHGIDFPVIISVLDAGGGNSVHLKAFAEVEAVAHKLAGKKVKEQFWDTGKQELQPIILRCAQFYENLYGHFPTLRQSQGKLYLPLKMDGRMPAVSLKDVGACAADILFAPEPWANQTLNITAGMFSGGDYTRSMTMQGSRAGGVTFEPVDEGVAVNALKVAGMVDWIAEANIELLVHYRDNGAAIGQIESDVERILGRKPRPFAEFAKSLRGVL